MTDPGLLQALDYIFNKSDESSIEVLAEAVVRRRRDMSIFNAVGDIPDSGMMSKEMAERINSSVKSGIEGMRQSVREMIIRIIKEHAPELSESQMNELCEAWLPGAEGKKKADLPSDLLLSMIEQFLSFSNGTMNKTVDEGLRKEMGAWPQRYWNSFPPVVRQLISDYLKDKISEKEFKSKIAIALDF
jgi:hypothetical protein